MILSTPLPHQVCVQQEILYFLSQSSDKLNVFMIHRNDTKIMYRFNSTLNIRISIYDNTIY